MHKSTIAYEGTNDVLFTIQYNYNTLSYRELKVEVYEVPAL